MIANRDPNTRPEGDSRSGSGCVDHNPRDPWPVSTTVVLAISSLAGIDPTELRPLNDVVDPDALNQHVHEIRERDAELSFCYHGYRVTVRGDGHIELAVIEGPATGSTDDTRGGAC